MVLSRLRRRAAAAVLPLAAALTVAPLLWMVSVSLMPKGEANGFPPPLLPSRPTLANYRALLLPERHGAAVTDYHVLPAIWNSVALAVLATVIGLGLAIPAGYALAKLRFRGSRAALRMVLALVVVPTQVAMLPLFLMLRWAGLVNSYAGVLAPGLAGLYSVLFARAAALSIPDEMLDAARLDGAGEAQIFRLVVLPLMRPTVVTLALFAFLGSWSDFLWPLIVLSDQGRYTLPVALAAISREHGGDVELMMAGAVVTSGPVLLLFLALQRFYFGGLLGGGVKG